MVDGSVMFAKDYITIKINLIIALYVILIFVNLVSNQGNTPCIHQTMTFILPEWKQYTLSMEDDGNVMDVI